MSEQDDTAELIDDLRELAKDLNGCDLKYAGQLTLEAADRLRQLHDRLTAIEQANAKRSAITERYYQQAVEETRDFGDD
jgi:nitrogen-specific signal transduction histidine kinase